jgi:hypothetical protein
MALVLAGVLQLLFGILRAEGLRAVTTRPPMMPVSRPTKGGKPLA